MNGEKQWICPFCNIPLAWDRDDAGYYCVKCDFFAGHLDKDDDDEGDNYDPN